jgi:pimeloyl-ACP methyl ester carboxylesterase
MNQDKKKKFNLGKVLRVIVIILIVLLAGLFIFHKIKHAADMKFLAEQGYYNPVSVGDYSMNVMKFGNENGKGDIVVLSGMGAGMAVEMRPSLKELEDDYQFIYVGRRGWDASDDTKETRSVEAIVEECRSAVKAAGIEEPYILMAHSMGGTYASYWVSKYPEEIKAFINIDGTYVEPMTEEEMNRKAGSKLLYKVGVNLGLGDILLPVLLRNDSGLSKDEWRIYCVLQQMSISSDAVEMEGAEINRNRNTTWNALTETDVPKLYISARHGDLSDSESEKANKKELLPYLNKMGNYQIDYLPGSHFIYKTEPEEFRNYVKNYLDSVE